MDNWFSYSSVVKRLLLNELLTILTYLFTVDVVNSKFIICVFMISDMTTYYLVVSNKKIKE